MKLHPRTTMLLIFGICAAPVIAAYLAYYVFKPVGASTNYGTLIIPQRSVPVGFAVRDRQGMLLPDQVFHGKWSLVSVGPSACDEQCVTRLYFMRQVRATQGAQRDRIQTVWLLTDHGPIAARILTAYPDTQLWYADPVALAHWFPAEAPTTVSDHIYVIDPNGNLMMRFPKQADPSKIKNDMTRLLKWSTIG